MCVSRSEVNQGWKPSLPREAAWSRQFPSPVVARGSSLWQLGSTFAHQFRRPVEALRASQQGPVTPKSHQRGWNLLSLQVGHMKRGRAVPYPSWGGRKEGGKVGAKQQGGEMFSVFSDLIPLIPKPSGCKHLQVPLKRCSTTFPLLTASLFLFFFF